jgi:hypothetical protein
MFSRFDLKAKVAIIPDFEIILSNNKNIKYIKPINLKIDP